MCGIIAAFNQPTKGRKKAKSVNDYIITQYEDQHKRGSQGFGIIRIDKDFNIDLDRSCEPIKFLLDLYTKEKAAPMIIAHHRHPTSTDNLTSQTHPMVISNKLLKYDYLVVHNGVITNEDHLKEIHEDMGFKYKTEYSNIYANYVTDKFNDSEAIAIEMVLFIEHKIDVIRNSNRSALIALQIDKKSGKALKVMFGRNNGDLNLDTKKGVIRISSEGEGEEIANNSLHTFSLSDPLMKIKESPFLFEEVVVVTKTAQGTAAAAATGFRYTGGAQKTLALPADSKDNAISTVEEEYDYFAGEPSFVDNKYIDQTKGHFNDEAKGHRDVLGLLDDFLDEELTQIAELIGMFKEAVVTDYPSKNDVHKMIAQVAIRIRTMSEVAKCTGTEKMVRDELEDQEENPGHQYTEAEIKDARSGGWPDGYDPEDDNWSGAHHLGRAERDAII